MKLEISCRSENGWFENRAFFDSFTAENDLDPTTKKAGVRCYCWLVAIILGCFGTEIETIVDKENKVFYVDGTNFRAWLERHRNGTSISDKIAIPEQVIAIVKEHVKPTKTVQMQPAQNPIAPTQNESASAVPAQLVRVNSNFQATLRTEPSCKQFFKAEITENPDQPPKYSFLIGTEAYVGSVKLRLRKILGVPGEQRINLIYRGMELEDTKTLSRYGVQSQQPNTKADGNPHHGFIYIQLRNARPNEPFEQCPLLTSMMESSLKSMHAGQAK